MLVEVDVICDRIDAVCNIKLYENDVVPGTYSTQKLSQKPVNTGSEVRNRNFAAAETQKRHCPRNIRTTQNRSLKYTKRRRVS